MASKSLGTLTIDLIARTAGFVQGMTKAERESKKHADAIRRQINALKNEFAGLAKGASLAFAAVATGAGAALIRMTRQGLQSVDALSRFSDQIGVSTEALGTLRYAAQQMAGVSDQTFDMSLRRMTRRIAEAAAGSGAAQKSLQALGLEAKQLAQLSPDEQFRAIAESMRGISSQGERLRATMAIFDTEGVPLVRAMQQGREAIEAAEAEARALGLAISEIDAEKVFRANQSFSRIGQTTTALSQQLAVQFAPILEEISNRIFGISGEFGGVGQAAQSAFGVVIKAAAFVADALEGVRRAVATIADSLIISVFQPLNASMRATEMLLRGLNKISLLPLGGLVQEYESAADNAEAAVAGALENIRKNLETPLPGDGIRKWADDMKRAADEAAAASLAMRKAGGDIEVPGFQIGASKLTDEFGDLIIKDLDKGFRDAAAMISNTRTEIERLEAQIERVRELSAQGFFAPGVDDEVLERLNVRLDEAKEKLNGTLEETKDSFSAFADQAARNIQDSFAQFLFDPFDSGLTGMLQGFADTMRRMVAEAASQQILQSLFGGFAGSSNSFLASLGQSFGGARAMGGPVSPGMTYLVGERGPEYFVPSGSGNIIPGGGTNVQVIDQRGAGAPPVDVSRQMMDGREQLRILIRGELMGAIADGSAGRTFAASGYSLGRAGSR